MQCTNCKSEILDTAKFCPECGNKVENTGKTCPNKECNRTGLPPEAVYCPDCGIKLVVNRKRTKIHKSKNTSFTSYFSGSSGLVGAHLIRTIENKSVEKNQTITSNYSSNSTVKYDQSLYEESNWDKFKSWFQSEVIWEIEFNWWRYLIDLIIVSLVIVCVVNFRKAYPIPLGLVLISAVHNI